VTPAANSCAKEVAKRLPLGTFAKKQPPHRTPGEPAAQRSSQPEQKSGKEELQDRARIDDEISIGQEQCAGSDSCREHGTCQWRASNQ
jgi:hypothetical protein